MNAGPEKQCVIFDADNTLWNVETFYNQARTRMCEYVDSLSHSGMEEISTYQQQRDTELRRVYGYSASRFARSFEDTIYHFVPGATAEQVRHVRALGEAVFAQKAELVSDVELVLRSLYSTGWYLGLLTAGEAWVQQKRISEFHLQGIFHAIEVVEQKTAHEFAKFCEKHGVERGNCWVVGDSKKSDIAPAISAGLRAILVPHENWAVVEGAVDIDESKYTQVQLLRQVLDVLGVKAVDFRPSFRDDIDCYGIFEGGGAKGLAHVGALKACEERKIVFKGVAGTSAGAIIAGLIAVGYTAEGLFSPDANDGTRVFDQDFIALLGRHEWYRAAGTLDRANHFMTELGRVRSVSPEPVTANPFIGWFRSAWSGCQSLYYWTRLGIAVRPLDPLARENGFFSLSGFQYWYNEKLARKLNKSPTQTVSFGDIDFDLRIVSADLRSSNIVVHSSETCRNRSVAEAVVASISIPLVFKPKSLGDADHPELHVDGGMLSNFPAWVFAEPGKASQEQLPVVGFELVDQSAALPPNPEFFPFLQALYTTAISGKKGLEIRGILNIHFVPIPVSASTLHLDTTPEMRRRTYSEGLDAARAFFPTCLQLVTQEQMAPFLYEAHRRIIEFVGHEVHLRVNVMDRNSLGRLSIRYRYNMDFDPDDRMDLPIEAGGAGQCFTNRKPIIVDLYRAKREYPRFRMSKYEQALVRSSLRSLLSVPIFHPEPRGDPADRRVMGTLNFDSDDLSAEQLGELIDPAIEMSSMISYVWTELAERGEVRS
jgi:predicted acylesterase/phospholipase RssA/FMN phosphatase YigB (HAD superfamily)